MSEVTALNEATATLALAAAKLAAFTSTLCMIEVEGDEADRAEALFNLEDSAPMREYRAAWAAWERADEAHEAQLAAAVDRYNAGL